MCLAIFKPAGKAIPVEHLVNAAIANPDGAGIAYATGDAIHIEKGFFDGAITLAEKLSDIEHLPAAIHLRWATQGTVDSTNCHPFDVGRGWSLIHNGIIQTMPYDKEYSDTFLYAERMSQRIKSNTNWLGRAQSVRKMEREIGASKLVFLNACGESVIVNEKDGHWLGGCWYSNGSYKKTVWNVPTFNRSTFGRSCDLVCDSPPKKDEWSLDWEGSKSDCLPDYCDMCTLSLPAGETGYACGSDLVCEACWADLCDEASTHKLTPEELYERFCA